MGGTTALQTGHDRVGRSDVVHRHVEQLARIVRLQTALRLAHNVQVEVMHPRLVQYDVWKLGEPILRILHASVANDVFGRLLIGLPEGYLVDPAGLLQHALAESEGFEHLHRPAGNAVGLPELQRAILLVHDAGADIGKGRQLRRQRQARRAAAHDQHVHLRRKCVRARVSRYLSGRLGMLRVPWLEAVQMELHF